MKQRRMIQGISLAEPAEMYEMIRRKARQDDKSMSELVREILDSYISAANEEEEINDGR